MKKLTSFMFAIITILTMLFSFLPMDTVYATKEGTDVTLKVRNQTGGQVSLKLVDKNGLAMYFVYEKGSTSTPLLEGKYEYYARTTCGGKSGIFNVNVTKQLSLSCHNGVQVSLTIPVGRSQGAQYCYGIYDYWYFTGGNWAYMGDNCQDSPAYVGEQIEYVVPDPNGAFIGDAWFVNSGNDACAPDFGPAYYYDDCW